MSIVAGDPITYIGLDGDVVRSYVSDEDYESGQRWTPQIGPHDGDSAVFMSVSRSNPALLAVNDEGVAWIRGHHNSNSEKARELLAIHKLVASAA